jgi:hypothetical protein
MSVPTVIDQTEYDSLPEYAQTNVYKAGTGKFEGRYVLDGTPVDGIEVTNPAQLRSALQTERQRASDLTQQLESFGDLNPADARSAIETVSSLGDWGDEEKRSAAVAQAARPLVSQAEQKAKAAQAIAEKRQKQLERVLRTDRARAALASAGYDAEGVAVLLPHVESQLKVIEVGDELDVQVWDTTVNQRRVLDDGGFAELPTLIEGMKSEPRFARNLPGVNAEGFDTPAGKRRNATNANGVKTVSRGDQEALNNNWEGIRDGTVKVVD